MRGATWGRWIFRAGVLLELVVATIAVLRSAPERPEPIVFIGGKFVGITICWVAWERRPSSWVPLGIASFFWSATGCLGVFYFLFGDEGETRVRGLLFSVLWLVCGITAMRMLIDRRRATREPPEEDDVSAGE